MCAQMCLEKVANSTRIKPSSVHYYEQVRLLAISAEASQTPRRPPIWKVADGIAKAIPEEQWKDFPEDASSNVDHHLYGAVRKSE
jgi:hypothetical protein